MMQRSFKQPHRWFIYSSAGLLVFLCLAIILAAMILMRRGYVTRQGIVTGSSMEPILRGPRLRLTCVKCEHSHDFAWDTCRKDTAFACPNCGEKDMAPNFDLDAIDGTDPRSLAGESVLYAPLRLVRTMRAKEAQSPQDSPTGLRRGDIVVFQDSPTAIREIKRLVGLPGEQISIEQGDLFVDGRRDCKLLNQALLQSILLDTWSPADAEGAANGIQRWKHTAGKSLEYMGTGDGEIDNRLDTNAHDSHALVPIQDFGFALQYLGEHESWQLDCKLKSHNQSIDIAVSKEGSEIAIRTPKQEMKINPPSTTEKATWIIVAIIDGWLVIGNDQQEWARLDWIENSEEVKEPNAKTSPIAIESKHGFTHMEQILVFRDIYYRGKQDSDQQTWLAADRLVVLGDNVSISKDSRERWETGLPAKAIKGIVLQSGNAMETLLRQKPN